MDMLATSRKRPPPSPLNAEARQPTASVGSISLPRAWPPPPTDNEVMLYWNRGRNRKRNCGIRYISPPPLRFVLTLRLQRGGRLLFKGVRNTVKHTCDWSVEQEVSHNDWSVEQEVSHNEGVWYTSVDWLMTSLEMIMTSFLFPFSSSSSFPPPLHATSPLSSLTSCRSWRV